MFKGKWTVLCACGVLWFGCVTAVNECIVVHAMPAWRCSEWLHGFGWGGRESAGSCGCGHCGSWVGVNYRLLAVLGVALLCCLLGATEMPKLLGRGVRATLVGLHWVGGSIYYHCEVDCCGTGLEILNYHGTQLHGLGLLV